MAEDDAKMASERAKTASTGVAELYSLTHGSAWFKEKTWRVICYHCFRQQTVNYEHCGCIIVDNNSTFGERRRGRSIFYVQSFTSRRRPTLPSSGYSSPPWTLFIFRESHPSSPFWGNAFPRISGVLRDSKCLPAIQKDTSKGPLGPYDVEKT
uniref:Uncharacterized protein n=1 Tax=Steinernema glaseri TaxID=37863 RepID=A0A1I7YYJ4_9BILA